jgi:MFS family permease
MATTDAGGRTRRDAPVSELVRELVADVTLLVRRETELATIEVKDKASRAGIAGGLLAGGATIALYALGTLIAAAVLGLAIVVPAWAAALIVALVLAVVATTLILVGRARLRAVGPLVPTRTLETVQEDIGWMREKTEELRTSE